MALAISIPRSFGPCAWSGNQFGCNPFSPRALVGKGGLCWARRDGGGVSPGLVIAAPSARAFLCAKPWGAKGDWGYKGKGLGKKVRREWDGGCGERRWLLAALESPWRKKYLMCGQFPSLWMTMRWWGLSLEPQRCWPTLEQWGHVQQQDLCGVDRLMMGWASLASSSYLTLRQEGWGLLSIPLALGTWERGNETTLVSRSLQGPIHALISLCPSSSPNHYVPSLEQSPQFFPVTSHSHPTKLLLQWFQGIKSKHCPAAARRQKKTLLGVFELNSCVLMGPGVSLCTCGASPWWGGSWCEQAGCITPLFRAGYKPGNSFPLMTLVCAWDGFCPKFLENSPKD